MQRADLQLLVNQRKPVCVLDPALVLCHARGPLLATRLTQVMEPWLTRSFWQALDASELLARGASAGDAGVSAAALSAWIAMREGTQLGSSLFRWIGDCLQESLMQESGDLRTLERYEQLAQALGERCEARRDAVAVPGWCTRFDPQAAAQDALVLSATLDGALLLSTGEGEPRAVRAAQAAGLDVTRLDLPSDEGLFAAERVFVRHALAVAGVAPLLAQGPRLAVLHVLAEGDDDKLADDAAHDLWDGARVWWYCV